MSDSTHERVAIDAARHQESAIDHINPAPKPVTAEQVLLSLIKSNKSERSTAMRALSEAEADVSRLTDEVARVDAIGEGLENALKAIRYPKASAPTQ